MPEPQLHLDDGVFLSLDLTDGDQRPRIVGYRAKRNSRLLDLSVIDGHDPADYWEPVVCEHGDQVVLEPEEFYLLLSTEGVSIPPEYAAEMAAYDPTSGELRTHYAGFFDPGFGYDEFGLAGSQAALEVRAHDVPFMVQNGQRVCRITFERLVEPAEMLYGESIRSNYQGQQSTLSKYFCRPQPRLTAAASDPLRRARLAVAGSCDAAATSRRRKLRPLVLRSREHLGHGSRELVGVERTDEERVGPGLPREHAVARLVRDQHHPRRRDAWSRAASGSCRAAAGSGRRHRWTGRARRTTVAGRRGSTAPGRGCAARSTRVTGARQAGGTATRTNRRRR